MKKIIPFFLIALFSVFITSCNSDDNNTYVDNDTIAEVYEVKNTNFTLNEKGYLTIFGQFTNPIYTSDMILIYRQEGTTNDGSAIWTLIPKVYSTANGSVEYTNDFTSKDFQIYLDVYTNDNIDNFVYNQTFRVVIIPAILGRNASTMNLSNYNDVASEFKIKDSNVIKIK